MKLAQVVQEENTAVLYVAGKAIASTVTAHPSRSGNWQREDLSDVADAINEAVKRELWQAVDNEFVRVTNAALRANRHRGCGYGPRHDGYDD